VIPLVFDDIIFDFDEWKKKEPHTIQRYTSFIGKPAEWLLDPIIDKLHPLLEEALKYSNEKISALLSAYEKENINPLYLNEIEFFEWIKSKDKEVDQLIKIGISSIATEGTASGLAGVAGLLTDIPISFGLILFFSNKISLSYNLNILDSKIRIEMLKAISAASTGSLEIKKSIISTFETPNEAISKETWKTINKSTDNLHSTILVARSILNTLGVNISKRKVVQFLPGLGAITGGVINGLWANESLQAIKVYSRYLLVKEYLSNNNPTYYNYLINK
jgi:hypothetical protein